MRNNLPTTLFQPYKNTKKNTQFPHRADLIPALSDYELQRYLCFLFAQYTQDITYVYKFSTKHVMAEAGFYYDVYHSCLRFLTGKTNFIPNITYMSIQRLYIIFRVPFNQTKYLNVYRNYCNNDVKNALDSYKIEFI